MCGRYALYDAISRLHEQFGCGIDPLVRDFPPRYNAAPTQRLPVIRQLASGERVAHLLRWGLIPSWAKDETIGTRLINARGETLAEKASFRNAFKSRRCLVPASGFYEWQKVAGGKQPYFIRPANDRLFAFAGLWERWRKPDGETLDTYVIITTDANDAMGEVHERMPVIVPEEDYDLWLSKDTHPELVRRLLVPYDSALMQMHPVTKRVGNVRNEGPELVAPLEAHNEGRSTV
ncbi:SOS response-associated peptidase [Azoarcus sp. PA01]|nr:SOS response-associated peptidase [Azoarcus sp. PA01]